ncbi:MAG: leucine-rich repeat protein [Synergistaceae bacterium]|jgi:hypothetical protein|nr:leucine-rich repeat protein [Synergistaceae bacterium]
MKKILITVSIVCCFFSVFSAETATGEELLNLDNENFTIVDGVLIVYKGNTLANDNYEVTIPEGVTALGVKLFFNFYDDSPDGVTNYENKKIKKLNLPSTLREIRYQSLSHIPVEELVIPDSINEITIGQYAFNLPNVPSRESPLKRVIIKAKNVILGGESEEPGYPGTRCFQAYSGNYSSLESVIFESENIQLYSGLDKTTYLFAQCSSLKEVVFSGTGSYYIGDNSFSACSSLERVVFSEGLIGISDTNTFRTCTNLKELILPESCRTLGASFLQTSSNTPHGIISVAILGRELKSLDSNNTFSLHSSGQNQPGVNAPAYIYAYPDTSSWNALAEARHIKNSSPAYPSKYTMKTLTRDAQITVQNTSGPGLVYGGNFPITTVHWDSYRWSNDPKDDGNLEKGLPEVKDEKNLNYPSFETTVLDAWYEAISADASVASTNPDKFLHNGVEKNFSDAGKTSLKDDDRVHFFNSNSTPKLAFWCDAGGIDQITGLDTAPNVGKTVTLKDSDGVLANTLVRIVSLSGELWEYYGNTDAEGKITLEFKFNGEYLVTPYDNAGNMVYNMLPISVYEPDIGLKIGGVTGDPAFDTNIPLSSGYFGGTFVQMADGGAVDLGFDPAHRNYSIYVASDTAKITLPISLYDETKTALTLTAKLDGNEVNGFNGVTAPSGSFGSLELSLPSDTNSWTLTLTSALNEDGVSYERAYTINIIRAEPGEYAGIRTMEGVLGLGVGKGTTLSKPYVPGAASYTAYVHPGQTQAILDVTVTAGADITVDSGTNNKTGESGGIATWRITLPVPQPEIDVKPGSTIATRTITTKVRADEVVHSIALVLRTPVEGVFTPDKVYDYEPASGQFASLTASPPTGSLPGYSLFSHWLSLGGHGGYVTYYYDEPVTNDPNNPYGVDFIVYGNAFEGGGCNEPASVQVSSDDITWYYLAGQRHYELDTSFAEAELLSGKKTNSLRIPTSGYPKDVDWGYADVANCSAWKNGEPDPKTGEYWILGAEPFNPYRYCSILGFEWLPVGDPDYNASDIGNIGDMFDLSWAVDADGKPVDLPNGIKYIRVQNVIDVTQGSTGDISPEIGTITRVNPLYVTHDVGTTAIPKAFTIGGVDIPGNSDLQKVGRNTYYLSNFDLNEQAVFVNIEGDVNDNIYVNKEAFYGGEADYIGLCDESSNRTVRVVIQNGEKEPLIYVIECVNGGDPDTNADLLSIAVNPGDLKLTRDDSGKNYTGTIDYANSSEGVALRLIALNPESSITLTRDDSEEPLNLSQDGQSWVSDTIEMNVGSNKFTVKVESKDGTNTNNYEVVITRKEKEPETVNEGNESNESKTGDDETPKIIVDTGGDNGGGVTVTAGTGKVVTDLDEIADVETIKKQLSDAGVLLKPSKEPEKVNMNAASVTAEALNVLGKMNLSDDEAKALVENGVIKLTGDGSIVSNSEAVLNKMSEAESSEFYKVEEFEPLHVKLDSNEMPIELNKKAVVSFPIADAFREFIDVPVSDVDVFKLANDGKTVYHFKRAEFSSELKAGGQYIITQKDNSTITIAPTELLKGDELLYITIEDDSALDYDNDECEVFDPINVGARNEKTSDSGGSGDDGSDDTGSSSGGCDAGFGAWAMVLSATLGFCLRRKK